MYIIINEENKNNGTPTKIVKICTFLQVYTLTSSWVKVILFPNLCVLMHLLKVEMSIKIFF